MLTTDIVQRRQEIAALRETANKYREESLSVQATLLKALEKGAELERELARLQAQAFTREELRAINRGAKCEGCGSFEHCYGSGPEYVFRGDWGKHPCSLARAKARAILEAGEGAA